jgi:hypothetical protein
MFTPDKHSSNIIRILLTSLAAYHPNRQPVINSSDDNNEHNTGQMERKHQVYNQLDKASSFAVADGFVIFTMTF